ncbi:MAG: MOSC N-terminal beta barrel domain-containing protein [Nocardioides sp.]
MAMSLGALTRYPVKSFRGEDLQSADVEPWGLAGDRRWMVVDDAGRTITARVISAMVLLRAEITEGGLRLHAPGVASIDVARPDPSVQVPVSLWGSELTAVPTDRDVAGWMCSVLGIGARLVWLDDPARRPTDQRYSDPGDRVSFADGFPLLLTSRTSLAALNDTIPVSPGGGALSMTRFRPNVVVDGAPAWAEDDWRRIRIGDATFRAVKGCARCVLTTVDPETAERGREPLATLARTRRWDTRTWFGINLIPDSAGVTVQVGDEIEVLDSATPGGGPLRQPG